MSALVSSATSGDTHQRSDPEYEPLNVEPDTPLSEDIDMGFDEQFVKPEGRQGDVAAKWAAYISAGFIIVVTWVIALSKNPTSLGWFFFHPTLQTLSIGMFTYGIMTLQPTSQAKTKAAGLTRHQLAMLALGAPAISLGTLSIVWNKSVHDSPHFTTWHGTIGIIAMAWMVVQILFGGGSVWFGGRVFGGNPRAKMLWKYHRLSGYVLFPLFLLAMYIGGAWSTWATNNIPYVLRLLAFTVSPIVLLTAVLVRMRTSKMQFF